MRKGSLLTLYLIVLFSILLAAPVAADQMTENLESRVIESFDNPDDPDYQNSLLPGIPDF